MANPDVSGLFCLGRSVVLPPAYAENVDTWQDCTSETPVKLSVGTRADTVSN